MCHLIMPFYEVAVSNLRKVRKVNDMTNGLKEYMERDTSLEQRYTEMKIDLVFMN